MFTATITETPSTTTLSTTSLSITTPTFDVAAPDPITCTDFAEACYLMVA